MIPQDPVMLVSYINMKLRDEYESLQEFCSANDLDESVLVDKLADAGYRYNENSRQFR